MLSSNAAEAPRLLVCRDSEPVPDTLRGAVVAIGNFDGLHLGHQRLIETAAAEAKRLGGPTAILTFDPHPRAFFAPERPHFRLTPEPEKLRVLSRLGVDGVFIRRFDAGLAATSARDFVLDLVGRELGAAGLVVGADFHFGRGREGTPALLQSLTAEAGISVTIASTVTVDGAPVSSSRIRAALSSGDVRAANRLLGYRWFVGGPVLHGQKLGRTLGFPTANLRLDPGCGLAHGIYAVRLAAEDGTLREGVASFGRRPTFDNGAPLLETHAFDYAGDLYGQIVEVEFLDWIRGEERFSSADALVERMRQDAEEARTVLADASGQTQPPSLIGGLPWPYTADFG